MHLIKIFSNKVYCAIRELQVSKDLFFSKNPKLYRQKHFISIFWMLHQCSAEDRLAERDRALAKLWLAETLTWRKLVHTVMADAGVKNDIRSNMWRTGAWQSLLTFFILSLAWLVGFSSRLFAVIRFESIIHEFDPW